METMSIMESLSGPSLTITLFGKLSVDYEGRLFAELPPQQSAALLAYLALNSRRRIPHPELLDLLWPESEPEKARQNLRQCLRSLRLLLEQPPFAPGSVLRTARADIRLNPAHARTDVAEFESQLAAAKQAADRAERISRLTRAVDLYQGELLPGFYQDYFVAEQHRLAERHLQALHALVQELEADGEPERALPYAHHLARLDPLSEEACMALMRLYALQGKPSVVLRQFQEWEARFCTELGQPPEEVMRRKRIFPHLIAKPKHREVK